MDDKEQYQFILEYSTIPGLREMSDYEKQEIMKEYMGVDSELVGELIDGMYGEQC